MKNDSRGLIVAVLALAVIGAMGMASSTDVWAGKRTNPTVSPTGGSQTGFYIKTIELEPGLDGGEPASCPPVIGDNGADDHLCVLQSETVGNRGNTLCDYLCGPGFTPSLEVCDTRFDSSACIEALP